MRRTLTRFSVACSPTNPNFAASYWGLPDELQVSLFLNLSISRSQPASLKTDLETVRLKGGGFRPVMDTKNRRALVRRSGDSFRYRCGAISHYIAAALDEGPIIEQDVVRVSHRDTVEEMLNKGRDLEKLVLSRAVRWHLENRILVYQNKTVVFA
jgi:hypothetical protein